MIKETPFLFICVKGISQAEMLAWLEVTESCKKCARHILFLKDNELNNRLKKKTKF